MTTGIRLVAAAPTAAQRRAEFGGDHHLDEAGRNAARNLTLSAATTWISAPGHASTETTTALGGHNPRLEPALADADYGTWTGHTLDQVDAADWLTDPAYRPPGGESLHDVRHRAGTWLDHQAGRTLTAVAPTTVIRALLAHALRLPPDGIWQLDIAPLTVLRLTHRTRHWHLHLK